MHAWKVPGGQPSPSNNDITASFPSEIISSSSAGVTDLGNSDDISKAVQQMLSGRSDLQAVLRDLNKLKPLLEHFLPLGPRNQMLDVFKRLADLENKMGDNSTQLYKVLVEMRERPQDGGGGEPELSRSQRRRRRAQRLKERLAMQPQH